MKHHMKIDHYISLLKEYNDHTNIYSKKSYDHLDFHVTNCQLLAGLIGDTPLTVYDLGSGSGLPSVIIAACNPHNKVFAVESKGRKADFLRLAQTELDLDNFNIVQIDVNEWIRMKPPRADIVTAKAFKPPEKVVPIALGLIKKSGKLFIPVSAAQCNGISTSFSSAKILTPAPDHYFARFLFQ